LNPLRTLRSIPIGCKTKDNDGRIGTVVEHERDRIQGQTAIVEDINGHKRTYRPWQLKRID